MRIVTMVLLVAIPPGHIDEASCRRHNLDTCIGVEYVEEAMCRTIEESVRAGHEPRVMIQGADPKTIFDAPVLDVECMCPCSGEETQ